MNLVDLSITAFIEELASDSPAPGGGSVAALAGSLSAALASMVGGLTVTKEKLRDRWEALTPVQVEGLALSKRFLALIDEDTESFNVLMAAFKLPKESDEEKSARSAAIQEATKGTTEVPFKTCACCLDAVKFAFVAADQGNPNAVTDAGTAAQMARAGAISAVYNVRVNLLGIKDEAYVSEMNAKVKALVAQVNEETARVEALLEKALG